MWDVCEGKVKRKYIASVGFLMEKYGCTYKFFFFDFLHFIALYGTIILLSLENRKKDREM